MHSDKQLRLLFISQSFYPHTGGVSSYLWTLTRHLTRQGHYAAVYHLSSDNTVTYSRVDGVDVYHGPFNGIGGKTLAGYIELKERMYLANHGFERRDLYPPDLPAYSDYQDVNREMGRDITALSKELNIALIHAHDFQLVELHHWLPSSVPRILTWHNPLPAPATRQYSTYLREHFNAYNALFFLTEEVYMHAKDLKLDQPNLYVVPPLIDVDMFRPDPTDRDRSRVRLGLKADELAVVCPQRFDAKSNHDQLLNGIHKVMRELDGLCLLLAGGASFTQKVSSIRHEYTESIRARVREWGLADRVRFLEPINYEDMPSLYRASDIVTVLSQQECFGLTVTEAMASERPVLGSDVGGIRLQIESGVTGMLVPVGDIGATAHALLNLARDDDLRAQLGLRARMSVLKRFNTLDLVSQHVARYREVIETSV